MNSKAIHEHREWMKRCGGSLEGYIKQYGESGEMIWAKDMAEMVRLYHLAQGHTITAEQAMDDIMKQIQTNPPYHQ
jgi:hypothetical protein